MLKPIIAKLMEERPQDFIAEPPFTMSAVDILGLEFYIFLMGPDENDEDKKNQPQVNGGKNPSLTKETIPAERGTKKEARCGDEISDCSEQDDFEAWSAWSGITMYERAKERARKFKNLLGRLPRKKP